jgi:alkanesulfonate monooxygenase
MEAAYKLWEGSWEDGAVLADKASRVFADPARVHRVRHDGPFYKVDAVHLCEPSPQRTPVLYQAGASGRGRDFAARHAECVFVNGPSRQVVKPIVADLRARAAKLGRAGDDLRIFSLATVIVGRDEADARAKHAEYRQHVSPEGALALFSGWTGIDFSGYALDDELEHIRTEAIHSVIDSFTVNDPGRRWTVRELAEKVGIGGRSPVIVGSPAQVADELIGFADETGVDGFNLAYVVMPESFRDFVELVVPELQRRGRYKSEYRPGGLREKLYGHARLPATHPAAAFRRL